MSQDAFHSLSQRLHNQPDAQRPLTSVASFDGQQHVTFTIDGQLFAASMAEVGDIVDIDSLTPVPQAPPIVRGLINVRGRIVTAIDLRALFSQPTPRSAESQIAITYEHLNELYAVIVDRVGDIISFTNSDLQTNLPNLSKVIRNCSIGIYRYNKFLVLVLSMKNTLDLIVQRSKVDKSYNWAEIIENDSR